MLELKRLWTAAVLVALMAAPAAAQRQEAEPELSDRWITTKIQASYFMDEDVKAREIEVRTVDGIVTLTGIVADEREKRQAVLIAETVDGVKDVVDRLNVEPTAAGVATEEPQRTREEPQRTREESQPRPGEAEVEDLTQSDAALLTRVKTQLALDADTSALAIDVDVDDGIVTLSGTVDSRASKERAVTVARNVDGVRDVRDNLTVRPSP